MALDPWRSIVLWSDECTFGSEGYFNVHNEHHYSVENPHCIKEIHTQGRFTVNVWAGIIWGRIVGPYFFDGPVSAQRYVALIRDHLPRLL